MSELEISKLNGFSAQWAQICDVNGDGKIADKELAIFEQGVKTVSDDDKKVVIDGITLFVDQIKNIERSGRIDEQKNTITFKDGAEIEYKAGKNVDSRRSKVEAGKNDEGDHLILVRNCTLERVWASDNATMIDIEDSNVFEVIGGNGDDTIFVRDSKVDLINGNNGDDKISVKDSKFRRINGAKGNDKVITDSCNIVKTKFFGSIDEDRSPSSDIYAEQVNIKNTPNAWLRPHSETLKYGDKEIWTSEDCDNYSYKGFLE